MGILNKEIKTILSSLGIIILMIATALLTLFILLLSNGHKLNSFIQQIPNNIGNTNIYIYEHNSEDCYSRLYNYNTFCIASYEIQQDDLAYILYSHFLKESDNIYKTELEAKKYLLKRMCYNYPEQADKLIEALSFLPYDFLEIMYLDGLQFYFSDEEPPKTEDGMMTGAYYQKKKNLITFYNFENYYNTAKHEIGHWFEHYISAKIDIRASNRITDDMWNELNNLNLEEATYNYALTSDRESFAILFEVFLSDYAKLKHYAPISFEYFSYYMKELLNLN